MVGERQMDVAASPSPSAVPSHRQLLANIDKSIESNSDNDVTTDDECLVLTCDEDGDASGILGVSISNAQTHMKSARTPAHEKEQALENSRGYFAIEPLTEEESELVPVDSPENYVAESFPKTSESINPTSPWQSQAGQSSRSSISRNILGSTQNDGQKRSGSLPAAILDSFKKMLTDFPSYPGFASSAKEDVSKAVERPAQYESKSEGTKHRSQSLIQPFSRHLSGSGLDGTAQSGDEENGSRPNVLRRRTSDHSIYLTRAVTGGSDFDNTNNFASVTDMANSRFKAIQDSLADSSIKFPKLPSISFGSFRDSSARSHDDVTNINTALHSGSFPKSASSYNNTTHQGTVFHYTPPREKKHPILTESLSHLTGDLVIMGGYRGSILRSADPPHHQVWVPVKVGLNLRKVDLELGLTHEDEKRSEEKIIPSGILAHIGPIDIARRLLKKVNKCPNVRAGQLRVHNYGYDWRLSPHYLSEKLITFLEGLECNGPDKPAHQKGALVVAHSLGGLITRHAVNRRPELFSGVIYLGAPQNCCNILGPLRNGDDVFLSSRVLTAQVNFTLRTSYALLPENGRCFINKETGERYDVDFFDIKTWEQYALSPCINPCQPPFNIQPRKGIMSSISETISSVTPTISTKRLSWFSSLPQPEKQSSDTVKVKIDTAKSEVESTAKAAGETIAAPKQEAQESLEPSMKSSPPKPSIATTVTIPRDQAIDYLTRTLAEVKAFKSELAHLSSYQAANLYPPHALIYGRSVPTVYGAKVASREAIKCADAYDDLAFAAGDGVVLASAAQLPSGYRCVRGGRVESDRGHVGLLGDLEAIGKCIAAVTEGRRRGVGLGKA